MKYLIGVDEVGRGPLAGPVCVCVVAIEKANARKVFNKFPALRDSKKMNVKNREEIFLLKDNVPEIIFSIKR